MSTYPASRIDDDPFYLEQLGEGGSRTARILLAEDDREMRCLLSWTLAQDGYEVVEAENGIELLQRLEPALLVKAGAMPRRDFDLVISDLRMPCFSAFAVLGSFRKHDPVTPVILITAFGDAATHAEAHALGVTTVIDKPLDVDQLRAQVRKLIRKA
jgi:DNA-binding NtrC family response regulator